MTGHPSDLAMIVRYVPHSRVASYLAAGWIYRTGFIGTHHGEYSALMEWPLYKGDPVEPIDVCEKQMQRGSVFVSKHKPPSFIKRLFGRWL